LTQQHPKTGRSTPAPVVAAPLAGNRKWLVLLAVGVGTFMSALDSSVANIVLPRINADFNSTIATVEWIITIYLLVVSGLLLTFGRLGDLRGHKSIYILGFGIFVAGSALCGLAPNVGWLIAFRGLQALGAAVLFANSPAIITGNFPAAERGRALGLQATMTYLGLTVGPSLGGWLANQFSWRAVFYINVPVGLLALGLSLRFIPRDRPAESAQRFDVAGAATFMAGLVCLLLALNQGEPWGWTSPAVLGLFLAAAAILGLFLYIESRVPAPMLDLSLFRQRVFSAAAASAIFNYVCLYTLLFLLPFYLEDGRGLNPAQAGLLLTAQPLVMAVSAPLSGALSDRIGSRLLSTLGMGVLAIGLFLMSRMGALTPLLLVPAALLIVGLGTGIFIAPNTSALMGSAPRNRQGVAAAVLATARNVGMVLGVGLAGAVFSTVRVVQPGSAGLFAGFQAAMLAATVLALLGVFTSFVRGNTTPVAR
jgi:EmrB/QacA subfamily drug resistance transporter